MADIVPKTAKRCLALLLTPVVRFCLTHAIGYREFCEICKAVFVETAKDELKKRGLPASASRLSVITGLQRRDTSARMESSILEDENKHNSLCTRIIGHWLIDKRFLDRKGNPRMLTIEGKDSEFAKLVRAVSTDPNPYSMLFALERIGAVEREGGSLKLVIRSYVPRSDLTKGYGLLASDTSDLIRAVEENLLGDLAVRNLHSTTSYDNIDPKDVPHLKRLLLKLGGEVHEKARKLISKFDRDSTGKKKKSADGRARVVFSTYSLAEDLSEAGSVAKETDES